MKKILLVKFKNQNNILTFKKLDTFSTHLWKIPGKLWAQMIYQNFIPLPASITYQTSQTSLTIYPYKFQS